MFFKKKKKLDLLLVENIKTGCAPVSKEEAIHNVGKILVDTGYVKEDYIEAMIEREKTYSTFMGSGLALPHGVEAAKKEVLSSGIAIMTFEQPISWDGEEVLIVIGVAGVGEDHLNILSIICEKMLDETTASSLIKGSADEIYKILAEKE
ncbi:MAG: PTS sugar transporter subunit IIA [Erysipelotrichaceae bacterium]